VVNSYKNQLDALISLIYFWNKTQHVSDSSSVHHQEFFTVYTALVYVIQVLLTACEQVQDEYLKVMFNDIEAIQNIKVYVDK
jgi:hypothetical protein